MSVPSIPYKSLATVLAKVILDHNEHGYSVQGACQHNGIGYEELLELLQLPLKLTLPHDGFVILKPAKNQKEGS